MYSGKLVIMDKLDVYQRLIQQRSSKTWTHYFVKRWEGVEANGKTILNAEVLHEVKKLKVHIKNGCFRFTAGLWYQSKRAVPLPHRSFFQ